MIVFALPAVSTVLAALWFIFWLASAIFIFSVGTPAPREGYEFITEVKWDVNTRCIFIYHMFALFWINSWIIGCVQFIIGASACIWYFEVNTDSKGSGTLGRAINWCFKYHLGSIAFGSFIIAVCQMLRLLFEYYRQKMGVLSQEIKIVKILTVLTGYLLWLMENCVKYISKNAYIQIALTNESFFKSAWNAFALMIKNADKFGFGASIGSVFMLFGCLSIAALTSGGSYIFLTNYSEISMSSPLPASIVIGIIAAAVGYFFLSIFSFSSDAIL